MAQHRHRIALGMAWHCHSAALVWHSHHGTALACCWHSTISTVQLRHDSALAARQVAWPCHGTTGPRQGGGQPMGEVGRAGSVEGQPMERAGMRGAANDKAANEPVERGSCSGAHGSLWGSQWVRSIAVGQRYRCRTANGANGSLRGSQWGKTIAIGQPMGQDHCCGAASGAGALTCAPGRGRHGAGRSGARPSRARSGRRGPGRRWAGRCRAGSRACGRARSPAPPLASSASW